METGANILWMMLTLYGCLVVAIPVEVGEGAFGDDDVGGTLGLICVAQVPKYVLVTPVPLAFEPDWS
jgi:hypothetical protein